MKSDFSSELASKALELRLENSELKGGFKTGNLYYQSVWWLNKDSYGHARLQREVTDAWVARRFSHGGHQFTAQAPELTAAEISAIPGASPDAQDHLKLEVMERGSGPGSYAIKVDEHKYWSMQTGEILQQYQDLREQNANLMTQLFGQAPSASTSAASREEDEVATVEPATSGEDSEFDSIAKLDEAIGIEAKCNSEIANIELVMGKNKSVWLVASQDKVVAKHQLLGGFGTGQWVAETDCSEGIAFKMEEGDQTMVQIDESSFSSADAQGFSTQTLYKMLVRSEREKGVVEHKLSFLNIKRKADSALELGSDGFEVGAKCAMKFRCMRDPRQVGSGQEERITAKNFFSKVSNVKFNNYALMIFRFGFERVGATWKVQRPYTVAKRGITLKKGKPFKITQD